MKQFWEKFKYWFVNVFWYHYKWTPLIVLLIAGIVFVLTSDLFKGMKSDYEVVLTSRYYITDEQVTEITDTMSELVGDRNGDGRAYTPLVLMNMTKQLEDNTRIKLTAYLSGKEAVLYIMDEITVDNYLQEDLFEPLSTFGIESDEENPCLLRVDQAPVFDRAGLAMLADRTDVGYYACFLKLTDEYRQDPEMMEKYELGTEILKTLMEME